MLLTILTIIIVLSVLIFAHEMGHFIAARKFGVKAEEFGFGFPPRIWGVYKNKEGKWKQAKGTKEVKDCPGTIYSVNWIPLGGFVKIKGENGGNDDSDSFISKKIWQRMVMLSAGVSMNIILAGILISIGLMIGLPQVTDDLRQEAKISERKIQVMQVLPDSPAAMAGLEMGDFILSVNNNNFISYNELQNFVDQRQGEELEYKIKRGQDILTMEIVPEIIEETGKGGIGVAIVETGLVSYPVHIAVWEGIKTTIWLTWAIILAFAGLLKSLIMGQGVSADLAGPVGIAAITGQMARMGLIYVLQFSALLSINLAILNFLPFPALDGGRFLFLIIEKIKGSPVKREIEAIIHNVGFAVLMVLVLMVTFRDVLRFGDKFKGLWERFIG